MPKQYVCLHKMGSIVKKRTLIISEQPDMHTCSLLFASWLPKNMKGAFFYI